MRLEMWFYLKRHERCSTLDDAFLDLDKGIERITELKDNDVYTLIGGNEK